MSEQDEAPTEQELEDATAEQRFDDGDEQIPPEEPTIGEALADVDFDQDDDDPYGADGSDDPLNRGGGPEEDEG